MNIEAQITSWASTSSCSFASKAAEVTQGRLMLRAAKLRCCCAGLLRIDAGALALECQAPPRQNLSTHTPKTDQAMSSLMQSKRSARSAFRLTRLSVIPMPSEARPPPLHPEEWPPQLLGRQSPGRCGRADRCGAFCAVGPWSVSSSRADVVPPVFKGPPPPF